MSITPAWCVAVFTNVAYAWVGTAPPAVRPCSSTAAGDRLTAGRGEPGAVEGSDPGVPSVGVGAGLELGSDFGAAVGIGLGGDCATASEAVPTSRARKATDVRRIIPPRS